MSPLQPLLVGAAVAAGPAVQLVITVELATAAGPRISVQLLRGLAPRHLRVHALLGREGALVGQVEVEIGLLGIV